jgi:putative SOS response-associated peptidase YedK
VIFSFSILTINANGHELMKHFHRPDDENRSIVLLNEAKYQSWLNANHDEARLLLHLCSMSS